MITCVCIFFILITPAFLLKVKFNKDLSDTLLYSAVAGILILFFFGIMGILRYGFLAWIFMSVISGPWIIIDLSRKSGSKIGTMKVISTQLRGIVLSYDFLAFSFLYIIFFVTLIGMRIHIGDEYSHWGSCVIYMSLFDEFGATQQAGLLYGNYVPGMSLFQYFFVKVDQILHNNLIVNDWLMYYAYNVLVLIFTIPLIKSLKLNGGALRQAITLIFSVGIPLILFNGDRYNRYYLLQVDGALGTLFGCGLAYIFIKKENYWYILCNAIMLSSVFSTSGSTRHNAIC